MSVTIVGTLEQIFTSGSDIVSEAVHVNFESPTDVPLPLHESIVFTERNPPVDIRDSLEAHLVDDHGFTSVTRVAVTRDGAMAEWTAVRPDSTPADIVLWFLAPLQQEGVEWGLVAVGNTSTVGSGYRSVEVGEDASSAAEGSIAIGPESTVPETSPRSVAIGEGAFIPENTPDRAVLRSKELWVRPHQDADRVDSAVILQDSGGNSRTIRATVANSLTVNGVPIGGGNTAIWGGIGGTMSNQADLTAALDGKSDTGHTHAWGAITGKPSTFPPSSHTHGVGDITASGTPGSTTYLRGDGSWVTPPNTNTTYSEITEAEISAGTASTLRTISGRRAQAIVNKARDGVALASSLSLVATSGNYSDLNGLPSLGTAAAMNATEFATAAQGGKADTAVQPAAIANFETTTQLNARDTANRNRANHTGTQPASTISDFQSSVSANTNVAANTSARHTHSNKAVLDAVTAAYTTGEKTKLAGIAAGATANQTNAYLLNRGNHTGNQAIHTITNLQEILDGKPIEIDPGNYSTAIGVDAQAIGNSSFAAGHGAMANDTNNVAVGREAAASGDNATVFGNYATASEEGTTAVGGDASASGLNATAVGFLSIATGNGSFAAGTRAKAHGQESIAIGPDAHVPATSPRSQAFGAGAVVPENTPDTTVIKAASLEVKPAPLALGNASTIALYDSLGNPHVIPATVGQTHSHSENTSPAGESLTGVGTYSTGGVLRSGTLQSFIPAITTGLWDVDIEAHALVYRNVATGGVYLFVGNGTTSYQQALGRLFPQTNGYTLNVNVSPSIGGGTALKSVGPSQIIDMRYTGFQTAGTTYVVNHGWKITARRVG